MITYTIILLYLGFMLALGIMGRKLSQNTPDDYFLAGRRTGPVVLFFTLIATNFSAFFFLGFAGAGYRVGYSYYPIMAFGTAFAAIAFYFIGFKAWQFGKERGYITPPEMIGDLMQSKALKLVFLTVMVVFTIPYLAIQPIGAGYLISQITGGAVPYFWGATILTLCMVAYTFVGGMRSVIITDVAQGVLMFVLMLIAVIVVGRALGGVDDANARVFAAEPQLFAREGLNGFFTPRIWFSYMLLWLFAIPMFPQVFMRFFVARSSQALKVAATLYPVVTAVLFIFPVVIGVLGHLQFPELVGNESDQILPMMLAQLVPDWVAAMIMVGALAAFMSTMDSQLLAMSSMLTRDFYAVVLNHNASVERQVSVGRLLVVILAVAGLVVALKPPGTIFALATEAFTGLAVLFPTTVAAIYWKRATSVGCIASIIVGELMLIGYHYEWLPAGLSMGFLPVIPIVAIATVVLVIASLAGQGRMASRAVQAS